MPSEHATETWKTRRPDTKKMRVAPTHPGAVFEEEFRRPSGMSQAEAARRMGMSANRLNEIVAGKRSLTAETAVLFEALTGVDARFWLRLQMERDLWEAYRAARQAPTDTAAPRT